jgi:hypothetical protein
MNIVPCPICNGTAEIQDRLRKDPRGAITHVTVACVADHWTILPIVEEEEASTFGQQRMRRTPGGL